MSNKIAKLLSKPEDVVQTAISKLEQLSGWPSEDVRLLSDMAAITASKISQLNLDPSDTTGRELFHALNIKFSRSAADIENRFNYQALDTRERFKLISELIGEKQPSAGVWRLKNSAAKNILSSHPPRKLMKHLKYRSIDSMLKREKLEEVFAALPSFETKRWLNVFYGQHAKLKMTDFENVQYKLVVMPANKWADTIPDSDIQVLFESGGVALWPSSLQDGRLLNSVLNVADSLNSLRAFSAGLKNQQMNPEFGTYVKAVASGKNHSKLFTPGWKLSWHTIMNHYSQAKADLEELYGPHIQPSDLTLLNFNNLLNHPHLNLGWWADCLDSALLYNNEPVSMNILDASQNYSKNSDYSRRSLKFFNRSFINNLWSRYLSHSNVESFVAQNFDEPEFAAETVEAGTSPYLTKLVRAR